MNRECPECRKLFKPERLVRNAFGGCCSRHCARIKQARHGIPSIEDKKAKFMDEVMKRFDDIFKLK